MHIGLNTTPEGLQLIRDKEAKRLEAYLDNGIAGVWTIGIGHTKTARKGMVITDQEAEDLFAEDVYDAEQVVKKYVEVLLSPAQFSALVSFVFNVGSGHFIKSTLLKRLNSKDYTGAADELMRWIYDNGKVLTGLTIRRADERTLFLWGVY